MQTVLSHLRNIRHSPFKMRVMSTLVKDKPLDEARELLRVSPKKSAQYLLKAVNSAVANAKSNLGVKEDRLVLGEIQINEGRRIRKPNYRARGQVDTIRSRYSHIRVVLNVIEEPKVAPKKQVKAKPVVEKDKEVAPSKEKKQAKGENK
ncbi:50S ribosomal protein L22 [candidate division WWE3 bacterium]|nr:50S ribosomal protein L22 [candidate division WWE3 bacterium]